MASPIYWYFGRTFDPFIDATTHGYYWQLGSDKTVDWSISNGFFGEVWNKPDFLVQHLSAMFTVFSAYADIKFNYVGFYTTPSVAALAGSEINVSLDGVNRFFSSNSAWALGNFNPTYATDYLGEVGDVFLNQRSQANSLSSYEPGSAGWFVFMHELGHVLGLKHPHDNGGTGRPTLTQLGFPELDLDVATIMSYNDDNYYNYLAYDPATPMILDVLALQYLYGKNLATNAGDSTFKLEQTGYYMTIWDASGNDTVSAAGAAVGWSIRLPNYRFSVLVDTLAGLAIPSSELSLPSPHTLFWLAGNMENAVGGNGNDTLYGNDLANLLDGGAGNDTLDGGAGADTLDGGSGSDTAVYAGTRASFTVSQTGGGVTVSGAGVGTDVLKNIEFIKFSDLTLALSALDITPPALLYYSPGTGDRDVPVVANLQVYFNEAIVRGSGTIVLRAGTSVIVETFDVATSTALTFNGLVLTINPTKDMPADATLSFDFPYGSVRDAAGNAWAGSTNYSFSTAKGIAASPTFVGTAGNDTQGGSAGNDYMTALAGNDVMVTSFGNDTLDGGTGSDLVDYSGAPGAVNVNLATGVATKGGAGTDKLISVERLFGTGFNDSFTGSAADETFEALGGNDTLDGGAGYDYAAYRFASGPITANLATGKVTGAAGNDTLINMEDVEGSEYADSLTGSDQRDGLTGWGGNDSISAGGGNDELMGGAGNDTLDGGSGLDVAYFNGLRGNYTLGKSGGGFVVTDSKGSEGVDNVSNVERLIFTDVSLATDMAASDAGGKTVLMMAAVLGTGFVADKKFAGLFLGFFDSGATLLSGAQLLVDTGIMAAFAGGADNASFVKFVYANVNGSAPDAATLASLVAPLNAHTTTQAQWMADMAASAANQSHVGLAGYAGTGLAYL